MIAIRGATQVDEDTPEAIQRAVVELCREILTQNILRVEDIVSALFTLTPDIVSAFPARSAREVGWGEVPMLHAVEIDVPGALPRCCRVLLHVEADRSRVKPQHVYLHGARALRPDLATLPITTAGK